MQISNYQSDRIQEMIKKKIIITDGIQFNKNKSSNPSHFRTKSFNKSVKHVQKKQQNDIVIMNMPPSNRMDFMEKDSEFFSKNNKQHENRTPFFSNPQIFSGIQKFQSSMFCRNHLNKQNCHNPDDNTFSEMKRYNSLNIRVSNRQGLGKVSENNQNTDIAATKNNFILSQKSSVPVIEFKPTFRQLLKRNTKIHSKLEIKLKKSEFNYQRAVSTSSESRKKAFQKILYAFQSNCIRKSQESPQSTKIKNSQFNIVLERQNISRQTCNRAKTCRKSPQIKQRKQKEQQSCRPWSAGKRNIIKLQNTEDQNPLQFYSINAKF